VTVGLQTGRRLVPRLPLFPELQTAVCTAQGQQGGNIRTTKGTLQHAAVVRECGVTGSQHSIAKSPRAAVPFRLHPRLDSTDILSTTSSSSSSPVAVSRHYYACSPRGDLPPDPHHASRKRSAFLKHASTHSLLLALISRPFPWNFLLRHQPRPSTLDLTTKR
jgi:hypothetical protein